MLKEQILKIQKEETDKRKAERRLAARKNSDIFEETSEEEDKTIDLIEHHNKRKEKAVDI